MTGPTAAPAHWPYAHPTVEEVRDIQSLPLDSEAYVNALLNAREKALRQLHVRPASLDFRA